MLYLEAGIGIPGIVSMIWRKNLPASHYSRNPYASFFEHPSPLSSMHRLMQDRVTVTGSYSRKTLERG